MLVCAVGKTCRVYLEQHPATNCAIDLIQAPQSKVAVLFVNIHDDVANPVIGLQVLRADVHPGFGKNIVDLGKDTRHVFVNVQQSMVARMRWKCNLGKVHRGEA